MSTLLQLASVNVVVTLLAAYTAYAALSRYWKLKHIPGPLAAKFTDLLRVYYVKTKRSHIIHQDLHHRYGDLVRLGPSMVSVSDPAAVPVVYPMRPGLPKGPFYQAFIPYMKGGSVPAIFTTQDEQMHRQLKSPVASLYSLSNVVTFEKFVDEVLQVLCRQVDGYVASGETFDLADWLQYFAFDVMGTMTFSQRYGFLETGKDVDGMLGTIWNFMLTIAPMTQVPWLDRLLYKNRVMATLRKQSGNSILKIAAERTAARKQEMEAGKSDQNHDFLSRFLEIQAKTPTLPPWAPTVWTFSNVIAGSDSTAVVMRTLFYHLLTDPASLHRLVEEFRTASQTNPVSNPFPSYRDVADLPFLDACVNEAVRLHPPFCLQLERSVPEGGLVVCGEYLPPGTQVGMNPYVVNRSKALYGEDADEWRPTRWLELDDEQRRKLENGVMTVCCSLRSTLANHPLSLALVVEYVLASTSRFWRSKRSHLLYCLIMRLVFWHDAFLD